jgi:hypothetical protein
MAASHLNYRDRVIPALTDHMEDNGGVVGLEITAQLLVSFKYSFENDCRADYARWSGD